MQNRCSVYEPIGHGYHVNQHLESYLLSLSGFLKLEISAFGEIWDESLVKQAACRSVGSVF